jgi:hypothetical protein
MSTSELPADAAYEAARVRALRTTEALILAEGQVVSLERDLAAASQMMEEFRADAAKLRAMRAHRRARDRARRERRRTEAEGVSNAAEDADPIGYTGAVGQAD